MSAPANLPPRSSRPGPSARDTILARVREALRIPAPPPHLKSHAAEEAAVPAAGQGHPGLSILPLEVARPWLPDGGETPEQRRAILVTNLEKLRATCGGRGLSIVPHVHLVVATPDQIVSTLGDALHEAQQRHAGRMPSMLSFITGPSRTGDIERILVLGAHGPKELIVILVG